MRCPDCNKFVSMENGEPEVNGVNCTYNNGGFDVTCEVHHTRNCADCGTELKAVEGVAEGRVELAELEGWDKLTPEAQLEIKTKLEAGEIEPETEDTGSEADESGGGRYAKNLITCTVHFRLTLGDGLTHEGTAEMENAASYYEESC